jgi:uncharacterized membrane protein YhaH (DUF805 family)
MRGMNLTTTPPDNSLGLAEAMTPGQILFSLKGRIPRRTYWLYGVLGLIGASFVFGALLGIAGLPEPVAGGLPSLLILWPSIAISAKRWHDRDKSAWWILINFIPLIGFVWALVENGFLRGTPGPNRFGEDLTGRI